MGAGGYMVPTEDPPAPSLVFFEEPQQIHARCHPDTPYWVVQTGARLTLICSVCSKYMVEFEVRVDA